MVLRQEGQERHFPSPLLDSVKNVTFASFRQELPEHQLSRIEDPCFRWLLFRLPVKNLSFRGRRTGAKLDSIRLCMRVRCRIAQSEESGDSGLILFARAGNKDRKQESGFLHNNRGPCRIKACLPVCHPIFHPFFSSRARSLWSTSSKKE